MLPDEVTVDAFETFATEVEPRLRAALSAYFVPDAQIANHPVGGDASGREDIRTALEQHRAQAAESTPYTTIDTIVIGFTAGWDHTWVDTTGQQWCGTGSSSRTAGGRIISWTYADEAPCE